MARGRKGTVCMCVACQKLRHWRDKIPIPPELSAQKMKRGDCQCGYCRARRNARRKWYKAKIVKPGALDTLALAWLRREGFR